MPFITQAVYDQLQDQITERLTLTALQYAQKLDLARQVAWLMLPEGSEDMVTDQMSDLTSLTVQQLMDARTRIQAAAGLGTQPFNPDVPVTYREVVTELGTKDFSPHALQVIFEVEIPTEVLDEWIDPVDLDGFDDEVLGAVQAIQRHKQRERQPPPPQEKAPARTAFERLMDDET